MVLCNIAFQITIQRRIYTTLMVYTIETINNTNEQNINELLFILLECLQNRDCKYLKKKTNIMQI